MNRKFTWYLLVFVLVLVFPLLLAFKLLQGDFSSLEELLLWVATGGGSTFLAGYVMAYLLENWPAWHDLPRWTKTLFPILLSGILAIFAQSLIAFDAVGYISPAVKVLLLTLINWMASQKAYKGIKESGAYGAGVKKLPIPADG